MSKILFVINPVAGPHSHNKLVDQIKTRVSQNDTAIIEIWDTKDKFTAIKQKILSEKFDKIIAAGGDGTISLISELALKTNTIFGIIPTGSGNGYARHLKIPLKTLKAIDVALNNKTINVDTAEINGRYFLNIAGLGFDALVSEEFSKTKRRGFFNYASIILKKFAFYKPASYTLKYNGTEWHGKAVVLDFALGSQYGNNAVISPFSDPSDGNLDICILKPFSFWYGFVLLYRFYTKSIYKSSKFECAKAKSVLIKNHNNHIAHYDGEPLIVPGEFKVNVGQVPLKILVS